MSVWNCVTVVAVASILGLDILPTIKKLPLTYCNIAAQQRTRLILSCLMAWGLHRRGKTAQRAHLSFHLLSK